MKKDKELSDKYREYLDKSKTLGYYVRNTRKLLNLSTQALSEISGLSVGYINRIEHDKTTNHNIVKLQQLAKALNVSDDAVLSRIGYTIKKYEKQNWKKHVQDILQQENFNEDSISEILAYIDTIRLKQMLKSLNIEKAPLLYDRLKAIYDMHAE